MIYGKMVNGVACLIYTIDGMRFAIAINGSGIIAVYQVLVLGYDYKLPPCLCRSYIQERQLSIERPFYMGSTQQNT